MSDRSFQHITRTDLKKLARIARTEREDFFERHPEWALLYRKRIVCVALCRDSALHYLNGSTGVNDFDVWTFYAGHSEAPFPFQHAGRWDYGKSKFGRDPVYQEAYQGRRVELRGARSSAGRETIRSWCCRPTSRQARRRRRENCGIMPWCCWSRKISSAMWCGLR